jgi:hypothetical protein
MKVFITLASLGFAAAALEGDYLRDIMTESTVRAFAKDPTTGKFTCEPGFTGSDCSQKKCPYSMAFATSDIKADWLFTPSTAKATKSWFPSMAGTANTGASQVTKDTTFDNQHVYMECGGRGLCDRSTGQCKCFSSFTGEGCRRTTCPNDCSGHGQCRTDANSFYYLGQTPTSPYGGQIPDHSKTPGASTWGIHTSWLKYQQCHCDAGYQGDDCSLRMCPKGDDPETECANDLGNDKQKISCAFAKDKDGAGAAELKKAFIYLRFTDQFNGVYDTRPILIDTDKKPAEVANSIQDALEALPNFAIPQIEIDVDLANKKAPVIDVEFTDGHNTGKQPLLVVMDHAACKSGSQPKFEKVTLVSGANADITCTVTRVPLTNNEYKEHATCSNRGICDQSTGLCNCFDGYFGSACDNVNTYI